MRRCKPQSRWLVVFCAIFGLLTVNCGDGGGEETVYLHVFNAYPGSQSLSLYGPAGAVTTDLPFGVRTSEPVPVDRDLGTEFELVLDGASTTFDIDQQLYSLYPEETGTFLFSRRQDNTAHAQILRHIQSISPACRLVFHNSLALSNDTLGVYDFIVGWNFTGNIAAAGYDRQREQNFLNEHEDDLPDDAFDNDDERVERVYEAFDGSSPINTHPFFVLSEGGQGAEEEEEVDDLDVLRFVWMGPEQFVDRPRYEFESGNFASEPTTDDYIECLEGMLEAQEAVEDGDADEQMHEEANQNCAQRQTYNTPNFGPDEQEVAGTIHYYPESLPGTLPDGTPRGPHDCHADLRLYTDFANVFHGDHGFENHPTYDELTDVEDDPRVRLFPRFERSDHQFYVLYGRPIEPRIEQWQASNPESGGGFHDMEPYPE